MVSLRAFLGVFTLFVVFYLLDSIVIGVEILGEIPTSRFPTVKCFITLSTGQSHFLVQDYSHQSETDRENTWRGTKGEKYIWSYSGTLVGRLR